jgi:glycine hydroxymethyltransferase
MNERSVNESHWPAERDSELFSIVERELERQNTTLQLIASENFTSPAVLQVTGSVLTNKYSEGYPGKRYYGGNEVIDQVEELARERARSLFGAEHANVQPHSGANANMAVYLSLLQPGDTVLGMRLDQGGHLTHGSPVNASGKLYRFVAYGVTQSDERIDFDEVREVARRERPKLIVAGATAYPRIIDPRPFRDIADEIGALFMFDAAHVAGLIAGGQHPNPVEHGADIVTFTTHKTLRGPRAGCILSTAALADTIDKSVFPGLQGGPLDHVIAAKAVAFFEAAQPEFKEYAAQIVRNAEALARSLAEHDLRLVSGGTDNHLMLVDLRTFDADLSGKKARLALDKAGISLNENTVPDDPRPPYITSGLRIGTPATTTQGMKETEMAVVGSLIHRVLVGRGDEAELAAVREEVLDLCSRFIPYP